MDKQPYNEKDELQKRLLAGDETAKDDLWKSLYKRGRFFVKRKGFLEEDVNEAVHRTYLDVLKKVNDDEDSIRHLPAYSNIILTRHLSKIYRKESRVETVQFDDTLENLLAMEPNTSGKAILRTIMPCLKLLQKRELKVVVMRGYYDFTPYEVGSRLSIERNNVNQIWSRSRKKVMECLKGLGYKSADDIM